LRSPALAIAWEFRQRHRWGLIAVAGYLLVVATIKLLTLQSGRQFVAWDGETFAIVLFLPISCMFTYFLAVFTFGLSGDLAARQSMYPSRIFTLPVTTAALAGWPMLYGSAVMVALWAAARLVVVWPSDFDAPVVWPAVLAMSLLAWAQALTWMPYGLPGVRVVVTMLWLVVIDAVVLLALHFRTRESVMLAFLAPQVPLAYLVARFAVARARRGDTPDWRGTFAQLGRRAGVATLRRARFLSPARAQAWLEWRRHGLTLPAWVAILLPFELVLLWAAGDATALVFSILIGVSLTPPLMAAFVAATVRTASGSGSDSYGVSPFIATRPLTSAALIAAKLRMTVWSTIATWLLVLLAIPIALVWSDTWPVVSERARRFAETVGTPRAVVVVLLVLAGFIASTWKQLVQSLWVGLTGREWVVKASVFLALSILCAIGPILVWIAENRRVLFALLDALPWILAVLMCVKMSAAAWIATRLYHSRLLSDRTLVTGAAVWLVAVLALYGVLVWLIDTPLIARSFLALVAILAVPLARLSATPLALAWNRHR